MFHRVMHRLFFRPCFWALGADFSFGLCRLSRSGFPRPVALCHVPLVGGALVSLCFWICRDPSL